MKLVQLVFLFFSLAAGGTHASQIQVSGQSVNFASPGAITLTNDWLNGKKYPDNVSVYTWNIQESSSNGGCGNLCTTLMQNIRSGQARGDAVFTPRGEQSVVTKVGTVKIKTTFNNFKFYGLFTVNGAQKGNNYFPTDSTYTDFNSGSYTYSLNSELLPQCLLLGCTFSWKTGISTGKVNLQIEIPDKLSTRTFTIPETPVATFTTTLYSQVVDSGYVGDTYVMSSSVNIPEITITIPERCYTKISGDIAGNTVTFSSDIDASTVTAEGAKSLDAKSIQLTAGCNTKYISKSVFASVKIMPTNGVEDGYKFKLTPRQSATPGADRYLSVVAKHLSQGAAGATTCGNDANTFESGKFYNVGRVAFPESNNALKDPYPVTFNLCAFNTANSENLLIPGAYTGGVRLVTRFYTADQ
ncbi:hypothetical protein [Escherichia coli]|uniref:hypothetical protein n=1 Tax=Escherichia coli TaxID=562 RepID=UPI0010AD5790|nr:hypothetical protein [Escherichia coli]TJE65498.1 hypothetical protein C9209_26135 [Escherichia coli]